MPPSLPSLLYEIIPAPTFPEYDHQLLHNNEVVQDTEHPGPVEIDKDDQVLKTQTSPKSYFYETVEVEVQGNMLLLEKSSLEDHSLPPTDLHDRNEYGLAEGNALVRLSLGDECTRFSSLSTEQADEEREENMDLESLSREVEEVDHVPRSHGHVERENELTEDMDLEGLLQDYSSSSSLESAEDFNSFLLSSSEEDEEPVLLYRYPELQTKPYFTIIHPRTFVRNGYQNTKPYRPSTSYQRCRLYQISEVDEDIWLRSHQRKEEWLVPYLPQSHEPYHDNNVYNDYNNVREQNRGFCQGHYRSPTPHSDFSGFVPPPPTNLSHAPSDYNEYPQQHHHNTNIRPPTPQMGYPMNQSFLRPYAPRYCPPQGLHYGGGAFSAQVPVYQTETHSTTIHNGQTSGFQHNPDPNVKTCNYPASYHSQDQNSCSDALETQSPIQLEATPSAPVYQKETYVHATLTPFTHREQRRLRKIQSESEVYATLTPFTHREQRRLRKIQESEAEKRNPSATSKVEVKHREENHHNRAATWGPDEYQALSNVHYSEFIATHGQAGWAWYRRDKS